MARLILRASEELQVWITTRSHALAEVIRLEKVEGEMRMVGNE